MSSDKHCCVPGCKESGSMAQVLHGFPNPESDRERFNSWLYAIGNIDILGLDNEHIFKYRRVCRSHFEDKYLCRNNKISNIAMPTLNMSGPLHSFPSAAYPYEERFEKWKSVLSHELKSRGNSYIHGNIRLCGRHFELKYKTRGNRLTANSIPTLNLSPETVGADSVSSSSSIDPTPMPASASAPLLQHTTTASFQLPQSTCANILVETGNKIIGRKHKGLQNVKPPAKESKSATTKESNKQARLDQITEEIADEMSEPLYMDVDYLEEEYLEAAEEIYEPHDNHLNNKDQQCAEELSPKQNVITEQTVKNLFDIPTRSNKESITKETETANEYLDILLNVQKLNSTAWSEVKYVETQKLYILSPGFEELKANEEVQSYDNLDFLAQTDRSYAALTFCILKQQEALHECMKNLLSLAQSNEVSQDNFNDKIEEVLQKSEYEKISCDLLELVCGYRAEVIGKRRDAIINKVKDPVFRDNLKVIYPSYTHIFDPDLFTIALQKAGGVEEVFWPVKDIPKEVTNRNKTLNDRRTVETQTTPDLDEQSHFPIDMNTSNKSPLKDESHHRSFSNNDPPSQVGAQCVEQHSNVDTHSQIRGLPSNDINRGSLLKKVQKSTHGRNRVPSKKLRGLRKKQLILGLSDNLVPVLMDGNRIPIDYNVMDSEFVEEKTDFPVKTTYVVKRKRLRLQQTVDSVHSMDENLNMEATVRNYSKSLSK